MQYMQCYLSYAQVWKLHNNMYLNINENPTRACLLIKDTQDNQETLL